MTASEFLAEFVHMSSSDTRRGSRFVRDTWSEVFPRYAKTPPPSVALAKHAIFWKLKKRNGDELISAGKRSITAAIAASQGRPFIHHLEADEVSRIELADRNYGRMPK
jgi:hypothetical protein